MSKSKVCLSSKVCCTDKFLDMSPDAQALYYQLAFEAEITGEVLSVMRFARGSGLETSALDELYDNGYLLLVDGETYITHFWLNNKFDSKIYARFLDEASAYTEGRIDFAGEEGKSEYVLKEEGLSEKVAKPSKKVAEPIYFDASETPF